MWDISKLKDCCLDSGNRFSNLELGGENNADGYTSPFDGVNELSLDENLLTWEDVSDVEIYELILSDNVLRMNFRSLHW